MFQDALYQFATFVQEAVENRNITEPCNTQLNAFLDGVVNQDSWALESKFRLNILVYETLNISKLISLSNISKRCI